MTRKIARNYEDRNQGHDIIFLFIMILHEINTGVGFYFLGNKIGSINLTRIINHEEMTLVSQTGHGRTKWQDGGKPMKHKS
jgi:hypothetical protein